MNADATIYMLIAVIEAIVIGILLADKWGLIEKTEIDDNPSDNSGDTNDTKKPRGCSD